MLIYRCRGWANISSSGRNQYFAVWAGRYFAVRARQYFKVWAEVKLTLGGVKRSKPETTVLRFPGDLRLLVLLWLDQYFDFCTQPWFCGWGRAWGEGVAGWQKPAKRTNKLHDIKQGKIFMKCPTEPRKLSFCLGGAQFSCYQLSAGNRSKMC